MIGFRGSNLGRRIGFCAAAALGLVLTGATVTAEEAAWTPSADAEAQVLGLEDLIHIKVTSVSSASTRWMDSPAAVYVVTQEDIRRSGATSIQDALRQVPGVQVAQYNAGTWAISARGDNSEFAANMLVMIDGRSVYQPLFSGTYWDTQEVVMEDIDRIEVIRGPGATIWGSNAVNGIINVITKEAKDTQGGQAVTTLGTNEYSQTARWGGEFSSGSGHYRAYGKAIRRNTFDDTAHSPGAAGPKQGKVGFRSDWAKGDNDHFTVTADAYIGEAGQQQPNFLLSMDPYEAVNIRESNDNKGGHVLARWDHEQSDTSNFTLRAYVDASNREAIGLEYDLLNVDLDFKHRIQPTANNYLTWGMGYRRSSDDTDGSIATSFYPDSRIMNLYSGFIQNEYRTLDDRLRFTGGAKVENNEFTGWEIQPSVRFAFLADDDNVFWGAISRAVQTRSRVDDGLITIDSTGPGDSGGLIPVPLPEAVQYTYTGDDHADAERVYAFELGYRSQLREDLSLDISTYYNRYNNQQSTDTGTPLGNDGFFPYSALLLDPASAGAIAANCGLPGPCNPYDPANLAAGQTVALGFMPPGTVFSDYMIIPTTLGDGGKSETYGLESSLNWTVTDSWALGFGYSYFKKKDRGDTNDTIEKDPQHQFNVQSNLNLPYNLQLDTYAYYVDDMKQTDVDDYVRLDMRLGWQATEAIALSLVGQNLLENSHEEWNGFFSRSDRVPRAGYLKMDWQF